MGLYRVELATTADDGDLRAVLAATPMPGMVSVGFHREPSFFDAAVVDGRFRQVVAARDQVTGRVVGFGSRSIGMRYVNGQPAPIGYLSALRLLEAHRGRNLLVRGYSFFRKLHEDGRTRLYLTTIAQDNEAATAVLTAGRAGLPQYHTAGHYHTAAVPLRRQARPCGCEGKIEVREAEVGDLPTILPFLSRVGPQRQFFPCYEPGDFFAPKGLLRNLKPEDILLAFRAGCIVGTLAAWDQRAFRQDVIHGYGEPLRTLRPLYNTWAWLRGLPALPRPGAALRCLMGTIPVVADDDPDVFSALLGKLIRQRSGREWDYVLIGMHESDPLLPVLRRWPARWYTTCLYLACWEDGEELRRTLDGRPLYLELGCL